MSEAQEPTADELFQIGEAAQKAAMSSEDLDDPAALAHQLYQMWWRWADFELFLVTPTLKPIIPPRLILAEPISHSTEHEFVYPIQDFGFKLASSKGSEMYSAGMSMCKLYYTIEKMIALMVERIKAEGVTAETEVQVAFAGHELAQRKAFESIINLNYNVVVTNFDPGSWGERYLQMVQDIAKRGYGYPPESPRDVYSKPHGTSPSLKR